MYDAVLVPTDGSDPATAAVDRAIAIAERFDASLHVIHVAELVDVPADVETEARDALADRAESILTPIAERATAAGLAVSTEVVETADPVHSTVLDYADDHDVDLIVMGTHGRSGLDRIILGSVAERTLRTARTPVLVVPDEDDQDWDVESVLVPTDGSDGADAAADHAIDLCEATDAALHAVNVVDLRAFWGDVGSVTILDTLETVGEEAVDDVARRAEAAGLQSVETSVLSGTPARAIVDYADDHDVDLIVMGTQGRSGLDRYLLGSVAEHVVRLADRPVMTLASGNDE
ncbi:universal stress protein [Halomicrobium urmianum]|uniref:universal stress protein n=1 Tax=Halomicrobium urmianum TaxID=1586233 RepID=UPI001CD9F6B6|nr:universal stress protein [Halomicrobium urmianum]